MNFSLLKVEQPNRLKKISKNRISFLKKEEEVSLFHFNKLDNGLFHAVYNLRDEYKVGTKKLGIQHNYMYSSLINFFFLPNGQYAFIEYINHEYQEEVVAEIERKSNTTIQLVNINNEMFNHIYTELQGSIKRLNYSNEDGELLDSDYVTEEKFYQILKEYTIDDLTVLFENQFVTIKSNGRISVNNSDENYVYNFTKRILNAMV